MAKLIIHTHNHTKYSTNCFKLIHFQCINYTGKCECGCHFGGVIDKSLRDVRRKNDREAYAKLTKEQKEKRNKYVRYMRKTGKWVNSNKYASSS